MIQKEKKLLSVLLSLISVVGFAASAPACAYESETGAAAGEAGMLVQPSSDVWSVHGQTTFVNQWHSSFTSPYSGNNSLDPARRNNETFDATLLLGRRLWKGAEIWANPEVDQGFGLSNTIGVAGFSSGEAYKIGANAPYLRLPRLFFRQVISLDGEQKQIDATSTQFGGVQASNNVTLTIGKFSAVDFFDNNSYAHDPRSDFLNWSVIDGGAFDYAADSWGFTNGAVLEWNQGDWSLRGGFFQMSEVPNAKVTGIHLHQHMLVSEAEHRHEWLGRPGKVKLLAFVNRADMASYAEAVQLANQTGTTPDVSQVRRFASNPGFVVNVEQEIANGLGVFGRYSQNGGEKEAYEFTDINRSLTAGFSLTGSRWNRPNDQVGVAGVVNALSADARSYFSAGGMGILIGDGQLNYGKEKIAEAYYSMQLCPNVKFSLDYQHVTNPAYNQDRGPVSIYALRLHAEM